jgi:DNA-binding transcriptional LysR family regulator
VIETPAGRLENRREIPQDTLRLGHNTPLDQLASGRVLADLTAAVEETTDFDCLGKRADRRRKFGRGDCGLGAARCSFTGTTLQETALLEDLRALVEFAHAGSIAGAADRLFRTPSAITRQVQRLEAALNAELLDRSVKPPRLNSLGSRVLEQARDLLQRTEALKSLTSRDAEPHGPLRIGLSHALAEGSLIEPIQALTEKYPKIRVRLSSGLTGELINRLLAGELDVAAVLLAEGRTAPSPLLTNIIARDRMEIVQGAAGNVDGDWKSLGAAAWVLNPPGCFLRASLIDRMERAGFTPMIAAEIHNMHMQLAFVQSGYGLGLLPARFIARNHSVDPVKVLRPPSFDLYRSVAIVRVGQLGALGKAVEVLAHGFRQLFEAADTPKPVTSHRRVVPANRRAARAPK